MDDINSFSSCAASILDLASRFCDDRILVSSKEGPFTVVGIEFERREVCIQIAMSNALSNTLLVDNRKDASSPSRWMYYDVVLVICDTSARLVLESSVL